MAVISYKCPNCGGDLRFDPAAQNYKCEYCASQFSQEELEKANPQAEKQTDAESKETEQKDAEGAVVYSCPSCGAQIVTDETTAATFCYYCHNPVVLQGKLTGAYEPDLIIPFAVPKEKAVQSFLQYVRRKKFVPKDFFCKEQIEKISGIYFPFWVYSCNANGAWNGIGERISTGYRGDAQVTTTQVYELERRADLDFRNLTRDALNRENRQLVEAVQPFLLEQAKTFSMGYLSGFQAEKRDMEKEDLRESIGQEVRNYGSQMIHGSIREYTSVQTRTENVTIEKEDWKYLLLPVWVLTYQGPDKKRYYYAMNGQTGKISGVLPLDKKRVAVLFLAVFFAVFLILLTGGYVLW